MLLHWAESVLNLADIMKSVHKLREDGMCTGQIFGVDGCAVYLT